MRETTLRVSGMHCGSCAQRLGEGLERTEGVIKAKVDPAGSTLVRYDEGRVDEAGLAESVRASGFDLVSGE